MKKIKNLFEFEVTLLGVVKFEGKDYNYEAEISGGESTEPCFVVQIMEHGISDDMYIALKRKVIDELSKGKIALVYE